MNADLEAQEDELLALASIYGKEFRPAVSGLGGEIRVSLDLPRDFSVIVKAGDKHRDYVISYLPPLVLTFDLPLDYPSTSSPKFILSCKWLSHSQLSVVCKHLDEIWQDTVGSVVLFYWVQFLRDDLLDFLHIQPPLEIPVNDQGKATPSTEGREAGESQGAAEGSVVGSVVGTSDEAAVCLDPRALSMLATDTDLLVQLLDYDERHRLRVFEGQAYDCGICFMSKLGCSQFRECGHVYCNECMSEYFTVQIRDGNVRGLTCPEPECGSTATPSQSTLDRMADVIYCARKACVAPVVLEPDTTAALCPSCRYAFCTICRKTYHGTSNCKLRANTLLTSGSDSAAESSYVGIPQTEAGIQGLWEDYASGSEERRKFLEKRYGKHILNTVVEESLSEGWKGQNSKECPSCCANIQKNGGCNKMACLTCGQYFCWVCLSILDKNNPYRHFENPNTACFTAIFH
ncbi:E3 ubiquitin-protein ligase RNF14 isoform X2 [Coregonus clupeaformis]|uniref:E3 ubiquitin-protein ligase RNF14 isoform X2 n=1 Tax=Coregonus clupeaformis TaxID=59861 RepID=UPI001BE10C1F|nr:E3 ubiquitin-protein ligase RNF14 isoform X2 [Coregonus clupeaformis]